jgi:hypothetical protein
MTNKRTLYDFTQEQHALNNIADMMRYLFAGDPILEDTKTFDELTERVLFLIKTTADYEQELKKDTTFLEGVAKAAPDGADVDEIIDDLTFMLLHATIARQTVVIEQLTRLVEELDNGQ